MGKYINFIIGVMGGVFAGWGIMICCVAYIMLKNDDNTFLWITILLSSIGWYFLDTSISIISGSVINVIGNTIFFMMLMISVVGRYFTS